jgi:hypothetical protein
MMTPELFERLVTTHIKLGTRPCWSCPADPGRCSHCSGNGHYKFMGNPVFRLEELHDLECETCSGTGVCSFCNGQLVIVPDEYSPGVVCSVLVSTISAALMEREDNRFSDMNFILDMAYSWIERGKKMQAPETAEDIAKTLEAFGIVEALGMQGTETSRTSSALSEAELRELGLFNEKDDI